MSSDGIVANLYCRRVQGAGVDGWVIGIDTQAVEMMGWEWAHEMAAVKAAGINEPHDELELITPTEGFLTQRWYVRRQREGAER